MNNTLKGYLFALISALTYGMIPLFIIPLKKMTNFSIDTALFYRFFIAAIFILIYLFYQKESLKINIKEGIIMAILGLFYSLSSEFLFAAYDHLSPGIVVALILGFFFGEKISFATTISLVVVVIGVGILSIKDDFNINYIGLFISLLGALVYALYIIIINKAKISASGIKISFYSMLFASIYFLSKTLFLGNSITIPDMETSVHLSLFSFTTTVLSVVTLVYAIQYIGSTPTAIMGAVEPIIAVAISVWIFQEEPLTLSLMLGVVIIIIGVLIDIIFNKK